MSIIYTRKGEKALVQFAIGLRELTYPAGYSLWFPNQLDLTVAELAPHKVAKWSGEGLPPVGAVCELRSRGGGWGEAEIKYHGRGLCVWLWVRHDGNTDQIEYAESPDRLEFRPIRTAEQIAAEEHLAAVEQALKLVNTTTQVPGDVVRQNILRHAISVMIDAGYRKVEQ